MVRIRALGCDGENKGGNEESAKNHSSAGIFVLPPGVICVPAT